MSIYAYCRVSTVDQVEERSSLADQERKAHGVAMMRGEEITHVYSDPGVSGTMQLSKRPGGKLLLARLQPGDIIIAAKMDRIFRSALDALTTVEALQARGVNLILADMGTDPVTGNGVAKLFFSLLAAFAEFERTRIAERMEDGRRGKKARGGHIGGTAPYGYRVVGAGREAMLERVPEEERIALRAAALRANGLSLRAVGERLEAEGFRPRVGDRWHAETVRKVLVAATPR